MTMMLGLYNTHNHHTELDIYNASSMEHQLTNRHVAPLEHTQGEGADYYTSETAKIKNTWIIDC